MLALTGKTGRWEPKRRRLRLSSAVAQLGNTGRRHWLRLPASTCPSRDKAPPHRHRVPISKLTGTHERSMLATVPVTVAAPCVRRS